MARGSFVTVESMFWPAILSLKELGGSGSVDELETKVAQHLELTEAELGLLHRGGPRTEFSYRLAWARTFLKRGGAIQNSERKVWSLTRSGSMLTKGDLPDFMAKVRALAPSGGKARKGVKFARLQEDAKEDEDAWKEPLLRRVKALTPRQFEILSQRLLRESGFKKVNVTGRTGDEGIDGNGILQVTLVTFRVAFQCKRWDHSVGAPVVRDFRGAMVGRAEKGLIITTSHFTPEAIKEANREGAWVIDLIDGDALCDLLKGLGWGVTATPVERVSLQPAWFEANLVA